MRKKSFKKGLLSFAVMAIMLGSSVLSANACTSVFVGRDASETGAVMIARTEDYSSAWPKHFKVVPAQEYENGQMQSFTTGLSVPYPKRTYKFFSVPEWESSEGPVDEVGINEKGVAITATNTIYGSEKALDKDPFVKTVGVCEGVIPQLVLPRASTAREGVEILGEYIQEYGSNEGFGIAIADENEVWYLECACGHRYVARKIPDDQYLVVANGARMDHVDLKNKEEFKGSSDLVEFARKNKLLGLSEIDESDFDFAKAYGQLGERYNTRREWWGQHLFTPSIKQDGDLDRYPSLMKPDKKISKREIMNFFSSHYEGTPYDTTKPTGKDERAVGIDRTQEAHIVELRKDMPNELSGVMWLALGNPEYSVYLPFYTGIEDTPKSYQFGVHDYDEESGFWAFRGAAALAETDKERLGKGLKTYWHEYQEQLFKDQVEMDGKALEIYKKDPKKAVEYITKENIKDAELAVEKAKELRRDLMTKIADVKEGVFNPEL